ncbi:MAG: hypothetical protein AB7V48_17370 [Sedimentibacter sp.]
MNSKKMKKSMVVLSILVIVLLIGIGVYATMVQNPRFLEVFFTQLRAKSYPLKMIKL